MPPKRKASGPTRSAQQSTLAFHGSSNKVTKSGTRAQRTKKDTTELPSAKISEPEVANVSSTEEVEATNDDVSAVTHPEQTVVAQAASSTPEEDEARKITEAKIKAYWKEKEKARKAPRVHQQDLSVHEKILREFDMSSHYGPCVGITRTKRWQRAHRLRLNPPIEVLAVLLKDQESDKPCDRSRVDELLSAHNLENEPGT